MNNTELSGRRTRRRKDRRQAAAIRAKAAAPPRSPRPTRCSRAGKGALSEGTLAGSLVIGADRRRHRRHLRGQGPTRPWPRPGSCRTATRRSPRSWRPGSPASP